MASADLETLAYERAVYGAEEVTIRNGEIVEVKRKPSDAMLRLLLIGSNRKKYGYAGAAQRKAIEKELRAKILEEMATEQPSIEDVRDEVLARLEAIRSHEQSQGKHVLAPWGGLVPPGYRITWEGEGEEPGAGDPAG